MAIFKTLLKWLGIFIGGFFIIAILVAIFGDKEPQLKPSQVSGSKDSEATSKSKNAAEVPSKKDVIDWNVKDPNALTNGNILLALKHIKSNASFDANRVLSDAALILKSPWKYYGQTLCFIGTVTANQDYPAGGDTSKALGGGEFSEVNIFTEDNVAVSLLTTGDSRTARLQGTAKVCGLPVGRVDGKNAYGANITTLSVVGFVR